MEASWTGVLLPRPPEEVRRARGHLPVTPGPFTGPVRQVPVDLRVGENRGEHVVIHGRERYAARPLSSMPTLRKASTVPWLVSVARGCGAVPGRRDNVTAGTSAAPVHMK